MLIEITIHKPFSRMKIEDRRYLLKEFGDEIVNAFDMYFVMIENKKYGFSRGTCEYIFTKDFTHALKEDSKSITISNNNFYEFDILVNYEMAKIIKTYIVSNDGLGHEDVSLMSYEDGYKIEVTDMSYASYKYMNKQLNTLEIKKAK